MYGDEAVNLALWLHPNRVELEKLITWEQPREELTDDNRRSGRGLFVEWINVSWIMPHNWFSLVEGEIWHPTQLQVSATAMEQVSCANMDREGSRWSQEPVYCEGQSETPVGESSSEEIEALWQQRLKTARAKHAAEVKRLETALASSEEACRLEKQQNESRIRQLESELVTLQTEFVGRVREEIKQAREAQLRPWLNHALAEVEWVESRQCNHKELLDQVDCTLQKQVEQDRLAGQRSVLRQQLEELHRARDRICQSAKDALHPLPALKNLQSRVEQAIREHEAQLELETEPGGVASGLCTAIANARSVADLEPLVGLILDLENHQILSGKLRGNLLARIERRRSIFQDEVLRGESQRNEEIRVSDLLKGKAPGSILIDLYNLIGREARRLNLPVGRDKMPEAWKRFQPRLKTFAEKWPMVTFRVVVDSPQNGITALARNVRVEYSGGRGEHRADQALLAHLEHMQFSAPRSDDVRAIFVVSDDQDVRRQAKLAGAEILSAEEFARRILAETQG
jgi:hypothetical protein